MNNKINTTSILLLLITGSFIFTPPANADDKPVTIRRFALSVGANDGGADRVTLKFANRDARAFATVLTDLGGVSKQDSLLIENSTREKLLDGFTTMSARLKKSARPHTKLEVLFYYSGHSNETGLLLGGEILTYKEIKKLLDELPAEVRIGVLDSCASGTLVRTKGGTRTAPFLVDSSTNVKGYALLTSSSSDEAAQESDSVGGSYFTHYLISGMRGAADNNRDGKVSLNESYAYAFDETLHRTESSKAGPQHANYDFHLAGAGDLVLTDLRATNAVLLLAPELEGRIFIRDKKKRLVAEINKPQRRPVRLGIAPGHYEISLEYEGVIKKGKVYISAKEPTRITATSLENVKSVKSASKGDVKKDTTGQHETAARTFAIGFTPGLSTNGNRKGYNRVAINFIGVGSRLDGIEAGLLANIRTDRVYGAQVASGYNHAGELSGVQAGFVNNVTKNTWGAQGGLVNLAHTTYGAQGGLFNLNRDEMMGVQLGLINSAAGMYGIQGGLVNVLAGDTIGLQMGLANYSGNLKGAQIGIANVNGFVHEGAQIGLINIARKTTGAQVGLVNITATDLKGAQVGLVNFAGNGRLSAGMWVSDTALVNIGLKMGGKYTYGITGFSARVRGNTNWTTPFAGLGGHFDFHPFWFEMDGVCHWLLENSFGTQSPLVDLLVKTRFVVGARLGNQFSFFAGPVVNYLVSEVRDDIALSKNLSFYKYSEGNINHQISLGFMAGLQFEPQWGKLNIRKK